MRKVYKGNELEFRQDKANPCLYIGYKKNGKLFEEMVPGWGWTKAAFFVAQLETLQDW